MTSHGFIVGSVTSLLPGMSGPLVVESSPVGRLVCHNLSKGEKLQFHAPVIMNFNIFASSSFPT